MRIGAEWQYPGIALKCCERHLEADGYSIQVHVTISYYLESHTFGYAMLTWQFSKLLSVSCFSDNGGNRNSASNAATISGTCLDRH